MTNQNLSSVMSKLAKEIANSKNNQNDSDTIYGTIVAQDGLLHLKLDGAESFTPCNTVSEYKEGDRVTVRLQNHTAIITGNLADPSAGGERVNDVETIANNAAGAAQVAYEAAEEALTSASEAKDAADTAQEAADAAGLAAQQAIADASDAKGSAEEAKEAADSAIADAAEAKEAADSAIADAAEAKEAATQAASDAYSANQSANQAGIAASIAQSASEAAQEAAEMSMRSDVLHYLATNLSEGVTRNTPGWTTTIQNIDASKRYLWTYHEYTFGSATITYTNPVITGIYGESGAKGDTGISVTSVQPRYYLSTSSTSLSGGSWSNTLDYSDDHYIWCREKITYSDSNITYSTAIYNKALTDSCRNSKLAYDTIDEHTQYFWHDDTGAHVADAVDSQGVSRHRIDITSNAIDMKDSAGASMLNINGTSGIRIGYITGVYTNINNSGLSIYDNSEPGSAVCCASFSGSQATIGPNEGRHVSINSLGFGIYENNATLAHFGDTSIQLGQTSGMHAYVRTSGFEVWNGLTMTAQLGSNMARIGWPASNHITIDTVGLGVYNEQTRVALFGPGLAVIGDSSAEHVMLEGAGIYLCDGEVVTGYIGSDSVRFNEMNSHQVSIGRAGLVVTEKETTGDKSTYFTGNSITSESALTIKSSTSNITLGWTYSSDGVAANRQLIFTGSYVRPTTSLEQAFYLGSPGNPWTRVYSQGYSIVDSSGTSQTLQSYFDNIYSPIGHDHNYTTGKVRNAAGTADILTSAITKYSIGGRSFIILRATITVNNAPSTSYTTIGKVPNDFIPEAYVSLSVGWRIVNTRNIQGFIDYTDGTIKILPSTNIASSDVFITAIYAK